MFPAPIFCAVNVDIAFPIASIGTMLRDSILIPAEYPASAVDPKLLITAWTSRIPTWTMDCCSVDGTAIFTMDAAISPL